MYLILLLILTITILSPKKTSIEKGSPSRTDLDARIQFLLKQFLEKKLTIKEEYTLPSKLSEVTPENLEVLLKSILDHMKLKQNIFLVYHTKKERLYRDKAGSYEEASLGYKALNLVLDPKYLLEDYVSIIAHECAHHFMKEHNFREMEEDENEKNTDTLTVLLGFGRFLKVTHAKRYFFKGSSITAHGPTDYYETVKLGYLSQEEIEYLCKRHRDILRIGRKQKNIAGKEREGELHRIKELKNKLNEVREILWKNRTSLEQILSSQNIREITTREELKTLSLLIYTYENNTYEAIIRVLAGKLDSGYMDNDLLARISELDKILRRDSVFLESYLIE